MNINDIQDEIVQEFAVLNDGLDKYEHLIKLGQAVENGHSIKTEENLIEGCVSNAWFAGKVVNDRAVLMADSDSQITRGIIALLLRIFNNQRPEDIVRTELYCIDRIGLRTSLSPARSNGLSSVVRKMRSFAEEHAQR
jgi:cysteine desulfuration protein SufE